jgi:demethylspheroidene O-methyltransferase
LTVIAAPDLQGRSAAENQDRRPPQVQRSWRESWINWRNARLCDPRFQRWAADFPLFRPIARKRAEQLFDLVAGFVYSQTLAACVQLGLFTLLAKGPMSLAALAERLDLSVEATTRLMGAAGALGLVEALGKGPALADGTGAARYALGALAAALLGNAGLIEMIAHHDILYADLGDSVALLRRGSGTLASFWPYAVSATPSAKTAEEVGSYSALMAATLPGVAADVFKAYPIARHRRLMDVGGGEGAFLAAAAAHAPELELRLFDLPAVADRARARLARDGLADRAQVLEGDFLSEPLPTGSDLITLIRILHDHDDAGVLALLRRVRAALPADGALLIAEPMSNPKGGDRVADAYFAFYLQAMGRGRARSPKELNALLDKAGFTRRRRLGTRSPFLLRAILARP